MEREHLCRSTKPQLVDMARLVQLRDLDPASVRGARMLSCSVSLSRDLELCSVATCSMQLTGRASQAALPDL